MTEADDALRPAWKRSDRREDPAPVASATPPPAEPEADADDLERGRTLALVAALGRLQMSLDVLQRQQKKHQETVEERLARIERALSER